MGASPGGGGREGAIIDDALIHYYDINSRSLRPETSAAPDERNGLVASATRPNMMNGEVWLTEAHLRLSPPGGVCAGCCGCGWGFGSGLGSGFGSGGRDGWRSPPPAFPPLPP